MYHETRTALSKKYAHGLPFPVIFQITRFKRSTWGPPGCCWPQMDPMLVPWTLLSGFGTYWRNLLDYITGADESHGIRAVAPMPAKQY